MQPLGFAWQGSLFVSSFWLLKKAESNEGAKTGTSHSTLAGGRTVSTKLRGSSAQQLDEKSWWATGVFALTSLCFGSTPTEQPQFKDQISWKPASHSIHTKHSITFLVSHSPKAANDCSLYQTRNTLGLLQANFLPWSDLQIAISKGTAITPLLKSMTKAGKTRWCCDFPLYHQGSSLSVSWLQEPNKLPLHRADSHFNTKSLLPF